VSPPLQLVWKTAHGRLTAIEPTPDEVERYAAQLVIGYNEPRNAPLLGHTEQLTIDDVIDHYASMRSRGARAFLLLCDEALCGDADLRNIRGDSAEFAFLIAAPAAQGKGLGTQFARMLHAVGFTRLSLERIYASIVPTNHASRRVFDKLGYRLDDSLVARTFAEDAADLTMSIDRTGFVERNATLLDELQVSGRAILP
jgi:RimJ/RimL family protein N-acetyltransferase